MVVATVPMGKETCHPADAGDAGRPWLEGLNELARRFHREIWINRESVTRLAKAARQARFGDACPSWQRRLSTDFAPSPAISSTPGQRYREELPAR